MTDLFLKVFNMSISASWLIAVVIVLRIIFIKAPKQTRMLLWAIVAVRLICPVSLESVLSLIPSAETVSPEIMMSPQPEIYSGVPVIDNAVNPVISHSFAPEVGDSANPLQIWISVVSVIWVMGILILLAYAVISYWKLSRRMHTAVLLQDNIYQSENTTFPFVMGILQPKVYLPFKLDEQEMGYVIAHERAHIKRRDYWWKPLGFLLMTVYWFNPLMWIAYILFCRDIELACDEKVVNVMEDEDKAAYAQALLNCSVSRRMDVLCPLAFGEVGVKQRIKSILNYKKPAFWIMVSAVVSCIVIAVCFLTNPKTEAEETEPPISDGADEIEETEPPVSDTDDEAFEAEAATSEADNEIEETYTTSDFVYRYDEELGGIVIKEYLGKDADVVIPQTIGDSPVVEIGYQAFNRNDNITSVTISDGVVSIDTSAFGSCDNLTDITIPGSVTSIGSSAFHDCDNLKNITISDGVASIGNYAFRKCISLESIELPDSITLIEFGAFYDCENLTDIRIPDGVTSIEKYTFQNCSSLTDITIPDSVTAIREYAFYGCENLTDITIPDGATYIGFCAFYDCSSFTRITLPDSVAAVRTNAFYGCDKLRVTYKGRTYNSSNFDNLYNLFGYMQEPTVDVESEAEQTARAAYIAFISGDGSLLDDTRLGQSWEDFYWPDNELEYTFLDLDGDGVSELLVQWIDNPGGMNAAFHYSDGKLYDWNFDTVEMSSWEVPLQNGIMVYQYHYGGSSTWTGFRFLPNGEWDTLFRFFARYSVVLDDDTSKVPYYEVDNVEVDQETFDREFKKRITDHELERSAWTPLPQ